MANAFNFRSTKSRRRGTAGFTLAEVIIAGALLAVLISGSVTALTQLNRWATAARLRTIAQAVAQQRIDLIETTPWQVVGTRPTVLTAGTTTENSVPLNNDDYNASTSLVSAYTSLDSQVLSTRTTVITNLTTTTLQATVTVTFTYRNRPFSISLNTLRSTDSI